MGRLILCSGKRTDRPYVIPATGYRIYSIEELCYYIFNNIYSIDETLFTDSLVDWIGTELCLITRAEKLEMSLKQGADYKTLLAVVMCSSDYYTEQEIKKLLATVDDIRTMPTARRWFIKANSFLNRGQYAEAAAQYDRLLISEEAADLTPRDYGDVLHNLALANLHIYGLERALDLFSQAYERNHREETLRQYLCTLWLVEGGRQAFEEKTAGNHISEGLREDIILRMEQLSHDAKLCKDMDEIYMLKNMMNSGKLDEVREKCDLMIYGWIGEMRVGARHR
jgi:tetratricopeptide (TPR) repeat protein